VEHRADAVSSTSIGRDRSRRRRPVTHRAFKMMAQVGEGGKLELTLPLPRGARVEVVVLAEQEDEFADLLKAAEGTMGFWDNPEDDAAWNNA
jgi:hypothetical protein